MLKIVTLALALLASAAARAEPTWWDAVEHAAKTGDRARIEALVDDRVLSLVNFLACVHFAHPSNAVSWCGSAKPPETKGWADLVLAWRAQVTPACATTLTRVHPVVRVRADVMDAFKRYKRKDLIDAVGQRVDALNASYPDGRIVDQRCGTQRYLALLGGKPSAPRILVACTITPGDSCSDLELEMGLPPRAGSPRR